MWRIFAVVGGAIWLATIAASATLNYLAGWELGRSAFESQVFAVVGLCADLWKALGPVFCTALWRSQRLVATGLSLVVWLACFAFAVTAALGLAARSRGAVVGGHEVLRLNYESVSRELEEVERRRSDLGSVGVPAEREAAIAAKLAAPLPGGTVASFSENCAKDHLRTRAICAEVAELRRQLATALEGKRLDDRAAVLRHDLEELRNHGAIRDSDPQAKVIVRLSFGKIAIDDVGLFISLLVVAMIELTSAFAPLILTEFVAAISQPVAPGRALSQPAATESEGARPPVALIEQGVGELHEYLSARIVLDASARVTAGELFADYELWCSSAGKISAGRDGFVASLDALVRTELDGELVKRNRSYVGLRILPSEARNRLMSETQNRHDTSGEGAP